MKFSASRSPGSNSSMATRQYTPYSTGTWGSRSMVMAGGAVATALREVARLAKAIGAHLLQIDAETVMLRDGAVQGPAGSVTLAEIAHTWYRRPQDLPADDRPARPRGDRRLQACPRHAAPSATRPMPRRSPSTPRPATSRFSTTSSSRTAASWSIRWWSTVRSTAALRRASARRSTRRCTSTPPASRWPRPSPTISCPARPKRPSRGSSTWRRCRPTRNSA